MKFWMGISGILAVAATITAASNYYDAHYNVAVRTARAEGVIIRLSGSRIGNVNYAAICQSPSGEELQAACVTAGYN